MAPSCSRLAPGGPGSVGRADHLPPRPRPAGGVAVLATGFVARLPIAMVGPGHRPADQHRDRAPTPSPGILSAAFQVAAAGGALVTAAGSTGSGQHRLLPCAGGAQRARARRLRRSPSSTACRWPCAGARRRGRGATQPAIGSMVRARWAACGAGRRAAAQCLRPREHRRRADLHRRAAPDGLPRVPGGLAASADRGGRWSGCVGAVALAVQRSTEPAPVRPCGAGARRRDPRAAPCAQPGLLLLVVGALGIGGVFGSYEVDRRRLHPAGRRIGRVRRRPGAVGVRLDARRHRLRVPALGPPAGPPGDGALRRARARARAGAVRRGRCRCWRSPPSWPGSAVAPALIANFSLTERLVPARLLTEGLTWTTPGWRSGSPPARHSAASSSTPAAPRGLRAPHHQRARGLRGRRARAAGARRARRSTSPQPWPGRRVEHRPAARSRAGRGRRRPADGADGSSVAHLLSAGHHRHDAKW